MLRRALHVPDYRLLAAYAGLLAFGLLTLTSASAPVGYDRFGDSFFFVKRQLLFGVLPGIFLFFLFARTEYEAAVRWGGMLFFLSLILLALVFIPGVGTTLGTSARSWLQIGPFTVQPAEFAKLATILFLAWWLGMRRADLTDLARGFLPAFLVASLPLALVLLQPDIGTAIVLFTILFGMLYAAGARSLHLLAIAGVGLAGFALLSIAAPYRLARLTTFLHPELDPQGIGYQINQASMAIGSGGLFGLGLGRSRQKFQYLPEVHADSIFAVIAEEMGFFITIGFIGLLLFIAQRMLRLAKRAADASGRLLAAGIAIWFISQSFFNISAMAGLLPLTGLPLPFVSHGGTGLLTALAAVGVLMNISKSVEV